MSLFLSMRWNLVLAAALSLSVPLLSSRALAEPSAADLETARSLYKEGKKLRDDGKLGPALAKFQAAYALAKTPILGLEVGRTSAMLGLLVEARAALLEVGHLPVATNESPEAKGARAEAAQLAVDLQPRIPSILVVPTGVPEGKVATVTVDGAVIPAAAAGEPRMVDPGHHVVTAKVDDGPEARVEVDLAEKEQKQVPIAVPAGATSTTSATPKTTPAPMPVAMPATEKKTTTSPLVWIGFGVSAVGLVAGGVTGALAFSKTSAVKDECPTKTCTPSQQSDIDAAKRFGTISTISFVVAGAGAIVGAIGLLSGGSSEPSPSAGGSLSWWIGPGSAGVTGAF